MSQPERFAPSVNIPGVGHVVPEGWMWIVGFAFGGCEWAIREATSPTFDLRGKFEDYNKRGEIHNLEACIAETERQLERLRGLLRKASA